MLTKQKEFHKQWINKIGTSQILGEYDEKKTHLRHRAHHQLQHLIAEALWPKPILLKG